MDIVEFCRRNDIANKLRANIDDIENGNGYIVFDGLQNKGALIRMTYNGVNVVLSPGPLLVGFTEIPKVITQLPSIEKILKAEFKERAEASGIFEPGTVEVEVKKVPEDYSITDPHEIKLKDLPSEKAKKKRSST